MEKRITLPPGEIGATFAGNPAVVSGIVETSPLAGVVVEGECVVGLIIPSAVELTNGCEALQLTSILAKYSDTKGRVLVFAAAPPAGSKPQPTPWSNNQAGSVIVKVSDSTSPPTRQSLNALSVVSILVFCLMLVLGIVATATTADANAPDNREWEAARSAALGSGAVAIICAVIATPLAYGAAQRYQGRRHLALMITSWVFYALSVINAVAIFALAFVPAVYVPAGAVLGQVILATVGWALMFAYAEVARRS